MATQAPTRPKAVPRPPRQRQRIPVFNPSDWPDDVEAGGRMYNFPPQGVVFIEDMHEYQRNPETRELLVKEPRIVAPDGYDAQRVADLICSDQLRGDKGFVVLEGPPESWDAQKAAAREVWIGQHEQTVEAEIASWESFCAARGAAGLPMPTQKKAVVLAYDWRRKHRAGLTRDPELICQVCAWPGLTRDAVAQHIREEHPSKAAQVLGPQAQQPAPQAKAAPVPVRPARAVKPAPPVAVEDSDPTPEQEQLEEAEMLAQAAPPAMEKALGSVAAITQEPSRADREAQGIALEARAGEVGLELTVADRKGLRSGDRDVMEDVTTRVTVVVGRAEAKKRAAEKKTAETKQ